MRINSFVFSRGELGGGLADLGTLLPLMTALVVINQLHPLPVLMVVALAYIASGLYYRLPMPIQPFKAASAIAISLGLSASVIGAAGFLVGLILLLLSLTNLVTPLVKFFPKAVVRGIQLSIGLILLRRGAALVINPPPQPALDRSFELGGLSLSLGMLLILATVALFLLFRQSRRFPALLVLMAFGFMVSVALGASLTRDTGWLGERPWLLWPGWDDLSTAFVLLVIPQLPLTLGNAVVGTYQTAKDYFPNRASRATPRALAASMGLINIVAGLLGAMPVCHGSGGLTAHYKLGARTGGANLMLGGLLLVLALALGASAISLFSLIPFAVLGTLLMVVGIYHALLAKDLRGKTPLAVAALVTTVTLIADNLAVGFAAGLALHYGLHWLSRSLVKQEA